MIGFWRDFVLSFIGVLVLTIFVNNWQNFCWHILFLFYLDWSWTFSKDDFSESSEVSTYLDGISSVDTSQSNLTETAPTSQVPEVVVTSEFANYRPNSPHRKLAATFSAPPTFNSSQFASSSNFGPGQPLFSDAADVESGRNSSEPKVDSMLPKSW